MKKNQEYNIALNVNEEATGYAVFNDKYKIIQPVHHTNGYGVRLFRQEQTKEDRRLARSARRNNKRRKWRIKLLNREFKPEIAKIDPEFFERLKQSNISPLDSRKKYHSQFFEDRKVESYYKRKYPTIFHLQKALAEGDEKADLRLVYKALHSLLTHRGHFYLPIPVSQFKPGVIDTKNLIKTLNTNISEEDITFDEKRVDDVTDILINDQLSSKDKEKDLEKVLLKPSKNKKRAKTISSQIGKALVGYKVDWAKLFNVEDADASVWSFALNDADLDIKLEVLSTELSSDELAVLDIIHRTYDAVVLTDILRGASNLPDAEIATFDKHRKDIDIFRNYLNNYCSDEDKEKLSLAYALYIKSNDTLKNKANALKAKKYFKRQNRLSRQEFYQIITDQIQKTTYWKDKKRKVHEYDLDPKNKKLKSYISEEIENNYFLPKQRNISNSIIPYQLNAKTFNTILEKQGKYYPFLVTKNPVTKHLKNAPYKLSELFNFTIPHYVGPLVTREDQIKSGFPNSQQHAWMIRKEKGEITPWNFDKKIDLVATANSFIRNLTAHDTYLLNEPVLPLSSITYQKYIVFDELSKIKINNRPMSASLKQTVFNKLFKKHKTVSRKRFIDFIKEKKPSATKVTGFSDPKKFNATYSSYIDYKKIFGNKIDEPALLNDFEKMIEWSTIFTDKEIFATKLKEIDWLSEDETKKVLSKKFNGWGRLSNKLLTGIKAKVSSNGIQGSILYAMENSEGGFNHWLNQPQFQEKINKLNLKAASKVSPDAIIDKAFTTPSDKKAVRQALKVLADIIKHYSNNPKRIIINSSRSQKEKDASLLTREQLIRSAYSKNKKNALITDSLMQDLKDIPKRTMSTKQYLYFQQLGRDALTGQPINVTQLWKYRVVHIIPRSKVVDESLDNKVLVSEKTFEEITQGKHISDYAINTIQGMNVKVSGFWVILTNISLISKYKNFLLHIDPDKTDSDFKWSIIRKQLTVHSQVISLLTEIIASVYPNTKIITVNDNQLNQLRYRYDLYSLPSVNDYHYAMDAYLTGVIGTFLDLEYPSLRPLFVYGDNRPLSYDTEKNKKFMESLSSTNLLLRILYGKDDKILSKDGNTIAVNSLKELIAYVKKVYSWKYINVSIQSLTGPNVLFNATIFPRKDNDIKSTRKLIRIKNNMPTKIYGGYSSIKSNHLALVNINYKNGKHEHRVFSIYTIWQNKLRGLEGKEYRTKLQELLKTQIMFDKNGKKKSKILSFRVLKAPIQIKQLVKVGKNHIILSSAAYYYPVDQLYLNDTTRKQLMDYVFDTEFIYHKRTDDVNKARQKTAMRSIIEDIIYNVIPNNYPILGQTNISKIQKGYEDKSDSLSISKMVSLIKTLLFLLHANTSLPAIKELGINSISLQQKNIIIPDSAKFIYTSTSGLAKKIFSL